MEGKIKTTIAKVKVGQHYWDRNGHEYICSGGEEDPCVDNSRLVYRRCKHVNQVKVFVEG